MDIETWSSETWLAGATAFIDAHVKRTGAVEQPHLRPWSTVLRAPTASGPVWMKAAGPGTAFEAGLYALLSEVAPWAVLTPLAVDVGRGWILLGDGGPPVSEIVGAMPAYARLQRTLAGHVDALLSLGVADMRAEVMPRRFEQALEAVAPWADAHDEAERLARLAELRGDVEQWCERLAAAPGSPTLDHNDLHAFNVLAGPRFYDWGDSVVAHPFASLLVADGSDERDAYLGGFADLAPRAELEATVELAVRVARIARCLVWQRAVDALPVADDTWVKAPFYTLVALLE
jgi:hypothetical protein